MKKNILLLFVSILLLTLGAKLNIELSEIPYTLQTFALGIIAMFVMPVLAFFAVLFYLIAGLFLPVFSGQLFGLVFYQEKSVGYLFAFLIAIFIFSKNYKKHSWQQAAYYFFVAHLCILILGMIYLVFKNLSWSNAWYYGFLILLPSAFLKTIILTVIYYFKNKK